MPKHHSIVTSLECLIQVGGELHDQLTKNLANGYLTGIRLVDVGQGDCFAITAMRDGTQFPLMYLDYGGLMDHPDREDSERTKRRMPVNHKFGKSVIVLSHWDKDHYWSAKCKNTDAKKSMWLVPNQWVSPQAAKFSAELENAFRWPENFEENVIGISLRDHTILIRKCGKRNKEVPYEDRNLTGLAVTIHGPEVTESSQAVLPGDCPLNRIPNLPSAKISLLAAPHHGSKKGLKHFTIFCQAYMDADSLMLISYGKNHFGHPDPSVKRVFPGDQIESNKSRELDQEHLYTEIELAKYLPPQS
ncbi:hypothetical protein [Marinobacter sp. LN3S78]|uniref:hypothetical protein n=1 Tax=Marinobacter sp. LN3S78 TaxID=3382300 RepID=UPI00387B5A8D